jgi:hypothetical protein
VSTVSFLRNYLAIAQRIELDELPVADRLQVAHVVLDESFELAHDLIDKLDDMSGQTDPAFITYVTKATRTLLDLILSCSIYIRQYARKQTDALARPLRHVVNSTKRAVEDLIQYVLTRRGSGWYDRLVSDLKKTSSLIDQVHEIVNA